MIISQAIEKLKYLLEKHGDVEVVTDCPYCKAVITPDIVIVIPTKVSLSNRKYYEK